MPGPPRGPSYRITTTSPGDDLLGEDRRRPRRPATRRPGPARGRSGSSSGTPAVLTTQPSGARLPCRMARPPSAVYACSTVADAAARPRRCPASTSGWSVENGSVVRTPPGAAWNSSTRRRRWASRRGCPSRPATASREGECTACTSRLQQRRPGPARRGWPGCRRPGARPPCGTSGVFGATLARHGTRREIASMSATPKSSSASRAAASRCSTVLVEPPMATSRATAFSNAARLAIVRGSTESSSPS